MIEPNEIIARIIIKQQSASLTEEEQATLNAWLQANPWNIQEYDQLTNPATILKQLSLYNSIKKDAEPESWEQLSAKYFPRQKARIWNLNPYFTAIAAIVTVVIAGVFIWQFYIGKGSTKKQVVALVADVPPGHYGAILTLSNGEKLVLDSLSSGAIGNQGNSKVFKADSGKVVYQSGKYSAGQGNLFNTLSTPRGRIFNVMLPDGTGVWLNAESSITYPVAFTGVSRRVEITGEAYFEVAKNPPHPFIIHINSPNAGGAGPDVQVLGTHLNVMAYPDEAEIKTTLLEGSVKVSAAGSGKILRPGQQAVIVAGGQNVISGKGIIVSDDTDTEQAIAWKNGYFNFAQTDIQTMLKQIARWYDVGIVYDGSVPDIKTVGRAPRNISLSTLVKVVELSGIHIVIEGNKIKVKP